MKRVFFFLIWGSLILSSQSFSWRILPSQYTPGTSFNVYLLIHLENNPTGIVVSETLPSGWKIDKNKSPVPYTKYKSETNTYKWLFFDNSSGINYKEIIYTVNVPDDAYGVQYFTGEVLTVDEKITTQGDLSINSSISRIIRIEGDLDFGQVRVGDSLTKIMRIYNDGNNPLNVSNIFLPEGFSADWFSGEIAPSTYKEVNILFQPLEEKIYSGEIEVISNKTEGNNKISVLGEGISASSVINTLKFYNINENLLDKNSLPVDEIVKVKIEFISGEENNQKETHLQMFSEDNTKVFEKILNEGDISSFYIPKNLLLPEKNYQIKVRTVKLNNVITDWYIEIFRTLPQSFSQDTNNNGIPDEQEPSDISNWRENLKTIDFNENIIEIETPENSEILYFSGEIPSGLSIFFKNLFGMFTTKIRVNPGEEIELKFTFPEPLHPFTRWYKYDPNFMNLLIPYPNFVIQDNIIRVRVKDGGDGDLDEVENGIIFDPGGPIIIKGDLDNDGEINISDLILCLRMVVEIDEKDCLIADINNDNEVDILDVILILKKIIGIL